MLVAESKNLSKLETDQDQTDIDLADRQMPDSRAKRVIQGNLRRLHDHLVNRLSKIVDQVLQGSVTPDIANISATATMAPVFDAAVRQGYIAVGTPDWEHTSRQEEMLNRFLVAEIEFFANFIGGLESLSGRLALYGGAAEGAFWRGFLSNLPSTTSVEWRLGVAEHCADCLSLASRGPFSKPGRGSNPLPTVPRNGDTQCLGNCRCHLVAGRSSLFNQIGVEVIAIGLLAINPSEPAAIAGAQPYQGLAEDYAYTRRRAFLEPSSVWSGLAAVALLEINALAESVGQTVRLQAIDSEIIDPVQTASMLGQRHIGAVSEDDDLLGAFVTILISDRVERGKITSIDPPVVVLDDDPNRTYRIDRQGRALLFKE